MAGLAIALVVPCASANGLDQLNAFVQGTKSGRTAFKQEVTAKAAPSSKGPHTAPSSTGTFAFQRPGKFRWSYEKPYEQLIIGDGSKLWIYDRDLNQVIVRKLEAALGGSPAALLAGDNALEKNFDLSDGGTHDGLEFVEAKPKAAESGFEHVRIGFRDNLPRAMELKDSFGNVTTLTFGVFERNATIDAKQFAFVPPKGADVVGE